MSLSLPGSRRKGRNALSSDEFVVVSADSTVPDSSSATEKLIFLQEFSGKWMWTEALQTVLGVDLATVKAKLAANDAVAATFAVVAFLRKRFAADEDIWEFAVEKGGDVAAKQGWGRL